MLVLKKEIKKKKTYLTVAIASFTQQSQFRYRHCLLDIFVIEIYSP